MRRVACLVLAFCGLVAAPAGSQPLELGFADGVFQAGAPARDVWLDRAVSSGARFVRLDSSWASIASRRPASPGDPADPAYRWERLDEAIRAASARGLDVVLTFTGAPAWAEGADRPVSASAGSWRPDADAYRAFAQAVGERYSGAYAGLPRVESFQPWNEPNLDKYLTPQWVRRDGGYREESPRIYRALLNAFYDGMKSVRPDAVVVGGGTAPFGDPDPGGSRMMPVRFVRELLCIDARLRRTAGCSGPARFDAFDHHPYSVRGPDAPALNADDVSVPDIGKLDRLIDGAVRNGTAAPRVAKRLWVLEISWDSSPPDPAGVPAARHARWLEGGLYRLWRQGVDTAAWFRIRDQAPEPSYDTTYQSAPYLLDGTPKPAATAFRFPFVVERSSRRRVRLWSRPPTAGPTRVQVRTGRRWTTLRSLAVRKDGIVFASVRLRGRRSLRAVQSGEASLTWTVPRARATRPAA